VAVNIDLAVIAGAIVAILATLGTLLFKAKKAGVDQQKAKEADSYAKHIQDIADAANARPSGGLSDDPNNRDR
jgi:hypothetical protein